MHNNILHKSTQKELYRILITCIFLCILSKTIWAAPPQKDSTLTTYTDGMFSTYSQVIVPCSVTTAEQVLDDFIAQFRGDPDLLFEWALRDLGVQEDDDLVIDLQKTIYDPETGIGVIVTDLIIPGLTTFKDITIESKITKTYIQNKTVRVFVDVYNLNYFMKKAFGTFYIIPISNNQVMLVIDVHMKFGWFFNIFVTQNIYKSVFEWRIQGFMNNMRKEMIRRTLEGDIK